jgi:kynurenine formamidase
MQQRLGRAAVACAILALAGIVFAQQKNPATKPAPDGEWLRGIPSGKTRVVDLTYAINDKMPAWPGDEHPFVVTINATPEKDGYFTRKFCMLEHYGTHMDAPNHFLPGKLSLDQVPADHFFGPAVVIDVRAEVAKDPYYRLTPERIQHWETAHGHIPGGAIVVLRTGWASR